VVEPSAYRRQSTRWPSPQRAKRPRVRAVPNQFVAQGRHRDFWIPCTQKSNETPGELHTVFIESSESGCLVWSGYQPGDASFEDAVRKILDLDARQSEPSILVDLVVSGGRASNDALGDLEKTAGVIRFRRRGGPLPRPDSTPLSSDLRARLRALVRQDGERKWGAWELSALLSLVWGDSDPEFDRAFLSKLRTALSGKWFYCHSTSRCEVDLFEMDAICLFMARHGLETESAALCDSSSRRTAERLASEWAHVSSRLEVAIENAARPAGD